MMSLVVTKFVLLFFPHGVLVGSGIELCQFLGIFLFTSVYQKFSFYAYVITSSYDCIICRAAFSHIAEIYKSKFH